MRVVKAPPCRLHRSSLRNLLTFLVVMCTFKVYQATGNFLQPLAVASYNHLLEIALIALNYQATGNYPPCGTFAALMQRFIIVVGFH